MTTNLTGQRQGMAATLRVIGFVATFMLVLFLGLWSVSSVANSHSTWYEAGVELKPWQVYLGTFKWYSAMAIVVGIIWRITPPNAKYSDGRRPRFGSLRIYRCVFAALPFFGLGTAIGKSMDSVDRTVGLASLIIAVGILIAFLLDDLYSRFWMKKTTDGVA